MMRSVLFSTLFFGLMFSTQIVDADVVPYFNRPAFDAAAGAITTEGFEFGPHGLSLPPPVEFPTGLILDSVSGGMPIDVDVENLTFGFQNTTPGGQYVLIFQGTSSPPTYNVTFSLPYEATAFGFDLGGFQPDFLGNGTLPVDFFLEGSLVGNIVLNEMGDQLRFRGFVSDSPFDSVTVTIPSGSGNTDRVSFDEVSFNRAIPEPSSIILIGLIFGVIIQRRRKHQ